MNQAWHWLRDRLFSRNSTTSQLPCFWQTDMHSHLIPGIDDGVQTTEQAMTCIRQLAAWGVQKIITTPHINQSFYPNKPAAIRAGGEALRQQLIDEQLPVDLEVAAEYMLDEGFPAHLDGDDLLSFGSGRFLLVETGLVARSLQLEEILFQIQARGYTPVLAHPERYHYFYNDPNALQRLRELGCLFQLNWMSLSGRYGPGPKKQAKLLLKHNWVDFFGSDMHRPEDLPKLQELLDSPFYEQLQTQPLRNQTL